MHEILKDAKERMKKAVKVVEDELKGVRTGRASPSILQGIKVEYYGTKVPINQVASITVPQPDLLVVHPWDKSVLPEIEKAIRTSDLGLNPSNDGNVIRIPIPPLTEERRKELVKLVRKMAEEGRVAIRNIRRDANEKVRRLKKDGEISEDDAMRLEKEIQKLTDEYIEKIDEVLEHKEKEIME
ncbi:ribosome recycling factor [bacterium]|nr:MAG: ribosome recycling factor [bacterium]RKZ26475.1 MAG: ribosome recycling factor [bacterium]